MLVVTDYIRLSINVHLVLLKANVKFLPALHTYLQKHQLTGAIKLQATSQPSSFHHSSFLSERGENKQVCGKLSVTELVYWN